jgi:threonine 3-dehydrogenase
MMKNITQNTLPMIAVVKDQPTIGFSLVRTTISTDLAPDEVLIQVSTVSFCGTDTHIYEYDPWAQSRLICPSLLGTNSAGFIMKRG